MKTPRYTADQVAEALRAAGGSHADAAERLGCHRTTILDYVRRCPRVRQARDEARAELIDKAESQLRAMVDRGEWLAVRFVLVTLGRDRGYSAKVNPSEKFVEENAQDDDALFKEAIALVYGRPQNDTGASPDEPEE